MNLRKLKIVITPQSDMGETSVGIIADKGEAVRIVEKWMLNSKYKEEVISDSEYIITQYKYKEGEVMDFVLDGNGELIAGEHWETK